MSQTSESESEKMIQKFMASNSEQNFGEKSTKRKTYVQAKPIRNLGSIIDYNLPLDLSVRNSRVLVNNCEKNDRRPLFSNIAESSMPNSENNNPGFIKAGRNIDSLMPNKTGLEFSTKRRLKRSNVKMDQLLSKNSHANSEDKKINTEFESKITEQNNAMVSKLTRLSEMSHQFLVSRHIVHNSVQEYELEKMPDSVSIKDYKSNPKLKSNTMSSKKVSRDCTFTGENKLTSSKQICHGDQNQIAHTEVTESVQPCIADGIAHVEGPSYSPNNERTCAIQHIRIHTSEKPYKCDTCGKSFTRKYNLDIHNRSHTGERPYKCDTCGKSFTRKYQLDIHNINHTGERPYKCDICRRTFTTKSNLNCHIKTLHKST